MRSCDRNQLDPGHTTGCRPGQPLYVLDKRQPCIRTSTSGVWCVGRVFVHENTGEYAMQYGHPSRTLLHRLLAVALVVNSQLAYRFHSPARPCPTCGSPIPSAAPRRDRTRCTSTSAEEGTGRKREEHPTAQSENKFETVDAVDASLWLPSTMRRMFNTQSR